MPKQVDHDQKRIEIVDAALRLVVRDGLDAATVRNIAAEAGTSVRPVQYYFADKKALLAAAHARVTQRLGAQVTAKVAALGPNASPREVVDAVVDAFMPTDKISREGMIAYYAFYAAELVDKRVRITGAKAAPNRIAELIEAQVRRSGNSHPGLASETQLFVFALPSAASGVIAGYLSVDDARRVLDTALDRLFTKTSSGSRSAGNRRPRR